MTERPFTIKIEGFISAENENALRDLLESIAQDALVQVAEPAIEGAETSGVFYSATLDDE